MFEVVANRENEEKEVALVTASKSEAIAYVNSIRTMYPEMNCYYRYARG